MHVCGWVYNFYQCAFSSSKRNDATTIGLNIDVTVHTCHATSPPMPETVLLDRVAGKLDVLHKLMPTADTRVLLLAFVSENAQPKT